MHVVMDRIPINICIKVKSRFTGSGSGTPVPGTCCRSHLKYCPDSLHLFFVKIGKNSSLPSLTWKMSCFPKFFLMPDASSKLVKKLSLKDSQMETIQLLVKI